MWFIGYITVYSYAAGFTGVLSSLGYPPPEAGVIAAVGRWALSPKRSICLSS